MARLTVDRGDLTVRLSPLEKLAAFRGNVTVPLSAVIDAEVEPDGFASLRGMRSPGTGIPGVIAYGVRVHRGGRDFAAVLGRKPALRIDLDPDSSPFGRITVTVPDPQHVLSLIRSK